MRMLYLLMALVFFGQRNPALGALFLMLWYWDKPKPKPASLLPLPRAAWEEQQDRAQQAAKTLY